MSCGHVLNGQKQSGKEGMNGEGESKYGIWARKATVWIRQMEGNLTDIQMQEGQYESCERRMTLQI